MLSTWQILIGIALPTVLIALILFLTPSLKLAGALIATGFCLSYWVIFNSAGSPFGQVFNWIFYLTVLMAILALVNCAVDIPLWLGAIVLLLLLRLTLRALLWPQIPRTLAPAFVEMSIDLASLIALGWYLSLEKLARDAPGLTAPLALWLLSAGSAAMLGSFFVTRSASLAAALAVFSFAIAIVAIFRRNLSVSRGAAAVVVMLLVTMLVHGYFFGIASDTVEPAILGPLALLAIAPFAAWAGNLPGIKSRNPKLRLATRVIAMGLIVAISAGWAVKHAIAEKTADAAAQQSE